MKGYRPESYGDAMADIYDDWYAIQGTSAAVACLKGLLEPQGSVLELGAGTGRLAIPLAGEGFSVVALDSSSKMLDELRRLAPDTSVETVVGDMAAIDLNRREFDLALIAYHTFFQLPSVSTQTACLESVRAHLKPEGLLVLEAFVAAEESPPQNVEIWKMESDRVVLSVSRRNDPSGLIEGQAIDISESGIRLRPWQVLYRTPAELDQLAEGCGFRLRTRHAGWEGERFDVTSRRHVSIYEAV